jgi:hypothetical protein
MMQSVGRFICQRTSAPAGHITSQAPQWPCGVGLRDAARPQTFDENTGTVGSRVQLIRAFNFSTVDLILGHVPVR